MLVKSTTDCVIYIFHVEVSSEFIHLEVILPLWKTFIFHRKSVTFNAFY